MEPNEKTFRYTYILKNLGAFYLIFLIFIVIISLIGRESVFFICDGVMIVGGLMFVYIYLNTNVIVSESGLTTKTLLGAKSLRWSEISHFSARGSSTRLHRLNESEVLTIGSRLDGYAEIFELLHQKRLDLFDIEKYKSFTHNMLNATVQLAIGIFLVFLGLLGYFAGIQALISTLIFGFIFSLAGFRNWYSSPRTLTLDGQSLEFGYLNKTISLPIADIAEINLGGQQQIKSVQVNSVLLLLNNRNFLNLSGYDQSPIVMYYVLKRWHQRNGNRNQS